MMDLARQIESEVASAAVRLRTPLPDRPGKWSSRQVIGHLVDSAANNHQRIVRALIQGSLDFPGYQQNDWVRVQHYDDAPWDHLIALFVAYNRHLARLIASIPEQAHSIECRIAGESITLADLASDYLLHLKNHLNQILQP